MPAPLEELSLGLATRHDRRGTDGELEQGSPEMDEIVIIKTRLSHFHLCSSQSSVRALAYFIGKMSWVLELALMTRVSVWSACSFFLCYRVWKGL